MAKPSWFFWVVTIFALLWGAFGVFDYWATMSDHRPYLEGFPPEMIAWIQGFPAWRNMVWLVGVASGMLAAVLLALRLKLAGPLFLLSLLCMVVGLVVHDLGMANGLTMYKPHDLAIIAALIVVQGLLWRYSARAAKAGVLR